MSSQLLSDCTLIPTFRGVDGPAVGTSMRDPQSSRCQARMQMSNVEKVMFCSFLLIMT